MILYAKSPDSCEISTEPRVDIPVEKIQNSLTYVLSYYGLTPKFSLNFSSPTHIKFTIDDTNIYLTRDSHADVVVPGPGLISGLDYDELLLVLISQGNIPVDILAKSECAYSTSSEGIDSEGE